MSFINGVLKTSAIVCMTAVTVVSVGGAIYGSEIAKSVIDASNGISRASNEVENVMSSTNESVKIINAHLGEACEAAGVSMKSISDMLATLNDKITNFKEEDKKEIKDLMKSITNITNVVSEKVSGLKNVNSDEVNKVVGELKNTVELVNNGIDSFFQKCDDVGKREINKSKLRKVIEWFASWFLNSEE